MGRPPTQLFASDLTGECLELFEQVPGRHDRNYLRGFMGFLSGHGVAPAAARDHHLARYKAELKRHGKKRPSQTCRDVAKTWNRMTERFPAWPHHRLTVQDNLKSRSLPFSAYSASFEQDVRAYLEYRPSKAGLFDKIARRAFAPATQADRARKIRQLAAIAANEGVPPSLLYSLRDLLAHSEIILAKIWEQHDYKPNGHAANLARTLISIAEHLQADRELLGKLREAHKTMRPKKYGMTERNLKKLHELVGEANLRCLIQLPHVILASIDRNRPTISDALLIQSALGVAVLFAAPMRAKNLAGLHHGQIDRDQYIVIPREEVKNDRTLHYRLPARVTTILSVFRERYLPLLERGNSTARLFISRTGKQKTPSQLSTQLTKFIQEQTGLTMNVHLFRHLAGYIFLKEHPGEYEPVRQLLGHKSLNTTIAFYTGLEVEANFARYDRILDRIAEPATNHAAP